MRHATLESKFGAGTYVYEQREDGLYYLITPPTVATLIGFTEQQMTTAGYDIK